MDILRSLSSPNIDICKKTLSLAIDLVGPRNIEEVMQVVIIMTFIMCSLCTIVCIYICL